MQIFGLKIQRVKFWANILSDISSDQNALNHLSRKTSPNQEKIQNKKHLPATKKRQKNNLKPRKKKKRKEKPPPAGHIGVDSSVVAEDLHLNCVVFVWEHCHLHHFTRKCFSIDLDTLVLKCLSQLLYNASKSSFLVTSHLRDGKEDRDDDW